MEKPQVVYRTSRQIPYLYMLIAFLVITMTLMSLALRTPAEDYQRETAAAKKELIGWTLRANKHAQLNSWSDPESKFSILKDDKGVLYRVVAIESLACSVPVPDAPGIVFINGSPIPAVVSCAGGQARAFIRPEMSDAADRAFSELADAEGATSIQVDGTSKLVQFPAAGLKRVVDLVK